MNYLLCEQKILPRPISSIYKNRRDISSNRAHKDGQVKSCLASRQWPRLPSLCYIHGPELDKSRG